jgi:hypothetical protein
MSGLLRKARPALGFIVATAVIGTGTVIGGVAVAVQIAKLLGL